MEDVIIRNLSPDDTEDIIRIYKSITQQPGHIDFKQVMAERVLREMDGCFVAEQGGRLVGYIVSYMLTGSFGIHESAWIPTFGVDPACMGHGIGQKLAEAVFDFYKSKGVKNVYSSVRWFDADVLSFMKTLGFDRSEFINLRRRLD